MGSTGRRSVTGMTLTAFVNAHVVPVAAEPFDGALLVEDGRDVAELTEPAVTAALAMLGTRSSAQHQPG